MVGNPGVVYLFPLLICFLLFYFFFEKRGTKALEAFAQKELLAKLVSPVDPRKDGRKAVIILMAMAFGLAALLRPQWGFHVEQEERGGLDILFAVDVSRSMLAEDVKPNRLERAKGHVRSLVKRLRGDRIGLIVFSGTAVLLCPLTMDYDAFVQSLNDLDVETISKGGTAISAGILEGIKSYRGEAEIRNRILLLVTDGEDHGEDPVGVAQAAGQKGIKIVPVGIGTKEGELIPVQRENGGRDFLRDPHGNVVNSRLNEPLLKKIASNGNGTYFRPGELEAGFDRIYRDELTRRGKMEGGRAGEKRYREWFQFPLALALVLLFLEPLINSPLWSSRLRRERLVFFRLGVLFLILPVLFTSCEWNRLREARALYDEGKYEEALEKYRGNLDGYPESEILNFNMGAVLYRMGDYEKSIECFSKVLTGASPDLKSKASYNIGNCKFRLGEQKEKVSLTRSVELYEEARDHYKKAIELDKKEKDGKYNLQCIEKKLTAISEKLENRDSEKGGVLKDVGIASPSKEFGPQTWSEKTSESKGIKTETGDMSKETAEHLLEQYGRDEEMRKRRMVKKQRGQLFETDKDW